MRKPNNVTEHKNHEKQTTNTIGTEIQEIKRDVIADKTQLKKKLMNLEES